MKVLFRYFTFFLLMLLYSCSSKKSDDLYSGFVNPPAEARPFMRWWWLGDRITEKEVVRQLSLMKNAGVGGVEINPIAEPPEADTAGTRSLRWLSPEWNNMVVFASGEAKKRGMITDLIVGSGWPFGGEFLKEDEMVQRVIINSIELTGGQKISETFSSLLGKAIKAQSRREETEARSNKLLFIDLVPFNLKDTSEVIDLKKNLDSNGRLSYQVPEGRYRMVYGIVQKGHRDVTGGAPGAAGPVMDHYKRDVTVTYLNRLNRISLDTGIPLRELIRALFCDSIELAGSNWTDNLEDIFLRFYGYSLEPYYPFVFYEPYQGYPEESVDEKLRDELKRVRYDFNYLLVRLFLDNFTIPFNEFCFESGLLSRYQAYGTPFLMGMMEGNLIPDIPESNNWLFSGNNMDSEEWTWNQDHGYMIWNLYAASGGHLRGRKIISCESMTNTRGVFKASLEDIKRHDDMNFITGINHSVLHGWNYSPEEKGFPGWIRFGEYFSEKNTWWPYFSRWADYNARLSFVFQNTKPVKNIAIIGPTSDVWGEKGLSRVPFHKTPWYCYRLWEGFSKAGSSCDYMDDSFLFSSGKREGRLIQGPMSYQAIILCDVKSINEMAAQGLKEFLSVGGRLVVVNTIPQRSPSLQEADWQDKSVREAFMAMKQQYPDGLLITEGPSSPEKILEWCRDILNRTGIERDVTIPEPDENIFQIRHSDETREIWFFTNPNRKVPGNVRAKFPVKGKIPWVWNPENGTRKPYPFKENASELEIRLGPLQSLLIVYEKGKVKASSEPEEFPSDTVMVLNGPWQTLFRHINGSEESENVSSLTDLGLSDNSYLNTFAGTVSYSSGFTYDGQGKWLSIDNVNRGVTEVWLNGKIAGVNWYGSPLFRIDSLLVKGENRLEIRHTTLLSNYAMSLKDNPTAARWTAAYSRIPAGITGKVAILK